MIHLMTDFTSETIKARREWKNMFKVLEIKEKSLSIQNSVSQGNIFQE